MRVIQNDVILPNYCFNFFFPRFILVRFQVNPTTLNLENCETQLYPITITPTIPVRKSLGLPKLSFGTPREAVIVQGCEVELKLGIKPVNILVKAACLQASRVFVGLKPIIPRISYSNGPFWNQMIGLPTIWVIFFFLSLLFFSLSSNSTIQIYFYLPFLYE